MSGHGSVSTDMEPGPQSDAAAKVVDVLVYKNGRLLDTVFTSKIKKRPTWITATAGPITTLYSVSRTGRMEEAAAIHWPDPSHKKEAAKASITVVINGETFPSEKFGRKRGTQSLKDLEIGELHCTWSAKVVDGVSNYTLMNFPGAPYVKWECTTEPTAPPAPPASSLRPPSSQSRLKSLFKTFQKGDPKTVIATFEPSDPSVTRRDLGLTLYAEGRPYTFHLLLSAILLASRKDDWKTAQSRLTPQELEAMISSDATGALPAYTPAREDRDARTNLHPTIPTVTPWRWNAGDRHNDTRDRAPTPSPGYEPA